jgi:hypothetical protein
VQYKIVCRDLMRNLRVDGSSILKQQINNNVEGRAQEDVCERLAKLWLNNSSINSENFKKQKRYILPTMAERFGNAENKEINEAIRYTLEFR